MFAQYINSSLRFHCNNILLVRFSATLDILIDMKVNLASTLYTCTCTRQGRQQRECLSYARTSTDHVLNQNVSFMFQWLIYCVANYDLVRNKGITDEAAFALTFDNYTLRKCSELLSYFKQPCAVGIVTFYQIK